MEIEFRYETDTRKCDTKNIEHNCLECMGLTFGMLPCYIRSGVKISEYKSNAVVVIDPELSKENWDFELHSDNLGLIRAECNKLPATCLKCLKRFLETESPCATVCLPLEKHKELHYVYVVITNVDYEGSRLETVKSSKEKAEDWINENLDNSCSLISIEQWEIDGDIERATDSWDYSHD